MTGSALDRAFAMLELLASEPSGLPLNAASRALDVPKSAAHRLLAALAERGYVRQDAETSRYLLTTRLVAVGFRYLAAAGIVDLVQPVLDELARTSGELVRLGVIDGERQTWVAKSQGARSGLRYDADMGMEAPLAPTASGQAWLACLTDEEAVTLVARQGFPGEQPRGPKAPRTLKTRACAATHGWSKAPRPARRRWPPRSATPPHEASSAPSASPGPVSGSPNRG
jgi:DNA-binding IclR family transcriptional regulator